MLSANSLNLSRENKDFEFPHVISFKTWQHNTLTSFYFIEENK